MVNKSLKYISLIILIFCLTSEFNCLARKGPAVVQVDKVTTCILFQRELHLEIARSPKSKSNDAMELYVLTNYQNNRSYLKKKGFRSSNPVYRYKWNQLTCLGKKLLIKSIFPEDRLVDAGWEHQTTYSGSHGETLWRLGVWFTGNGGNSKRIAKHNKINPNALPLGKTILIEREILDTCFKDIQQYPIQVGDLVFRRDSKGEYAEFQLPGGQAIYSQVLKFTPRVTASEVLEASREILKRSNLKNFRTIPSNYTLKIPSDLISAQFLPPSNPRRLQFEKTAKESGKFKPSEKADSLNGVTVFLDAGHGGVDPGAIGKGNVKEDEYAYDVMCRVKRILENETRARVFTTIKDLETGYAPRESTTLSSGKNKERIMTDPEYQIQDAGVALNLRWMLCNYLFKNKCSTKSRDEKAVFTSFHADSLHRNASGLMVYIPGADYYRGSVRKTAKVYRRRKEAKKHSSVKTSRSGRLKAEGFSNALAQNIKQKCDEMHLKMHSNQPIRKHVIRRGKAWVPAILRYTEIPTRVLVELANLQNPEDLQRIRDPKFREKLARMYVDALKEHFSQP